MLFNVLAFIGMCKGFRRVIRQGNIDRTQLHICARHAWIIKHDSARLAHRYVSTLCIIACFLGKLTKGGPLHTTLIRLTGID